MTEERIKELADEYWIKHIIPNVDKWDGLLQLIRTVAAEARKEGMEPLLVAMKEISNKPLTKAQMRAIARYHLLQESEWLKEQGCTR